MLFRSQGGYGPLPSGLQSKTAVLISLLGQPRGGIVLYARPQPHAVLLQQGDQRRRAYFDGLSDWTNVTENSVRSTAWANGLAHSFTYKEMQVGYGTLPSGLQSKTAVLISLLARRPGRTVDHCRAPPPPAPRPPGGPPPPPPFFTRAIAT